VVRSGFAPGATRWNLKDRVAASASNRIGLDLCWSRLAALSCWPGLPSELKRMSLTLSGFACYLAGPSVLEPCLFLAPRRTAKALGLTVPPSRRRGDRMRRSLLRCMSPEVAPLRHASGCSACLLIGKDRKRAAQGRSGAFDPTRTSGRICTVLFLWTTQSYDNDLILLALRPPV
jgi:hypothetical protein